MSKSQVTPAEHKYCTSYHIDKKQKKKQKTRHCVLKVMNQSALLLAQMDEMQMLIQPCARCAAQSTHCVWEHYTALRLKETPKCNEASKMFAQIDEKLEVLRVMGYQRIFDVCHKIRTNRNGIFETVYVWNLCALTGMMSGENVCVTDLSVNTCVPVMVNSIYKQFVYCLWLCYAVRELEACSGEDNTEHVQSDEEKLQHNYQASLVYCRALKHVHDVLDSSIDKLGIVLK